MQSRRSPFSSSRPRRYFMLARRSISGINRPNASTSVLQLSMEWSARSRSTSIAMVQRTMAFPSCRLHEMLPDWMSSFPDVTLSDTRQDPSPHAQFKQPIGYEKPSRLTFPRYTQDANGSAPKPRRSGTGFEVPSDDVVWPMVAFDEESASLAQ